MVRSKGIVIAVVLLVIIALLDIVSALRILAAGINGATPLIGNGETEGPPRAGPFIGDDAIRRTVHTLDDSIAGHVLKTDEGVAPNGDSPLNRSADICPQNITIKTDYGVRQRRQGQPTKSGPHHRRRRDVAPGELGIG